MLNRKMKSMAAVWILLVCGAALSGAPRVNAEEPETLIARALSDTTLVNYVNVEKILDAGYIREALEDILEKDLPVIYRMLTKHDLEVDDIFREALIFSNHGAIRGVSEIGGIVIKTDLSPKLFEEIVHALSQEHGVECTTQQIGNREVIFFAHSAAAYLDERHVLLTDARRINDSLDRLEAREGISQGLSRRLEDVDMEGIIWGAWEIPIPDVPPGIRVRGDAVKMALHFVRSAQRIHRAEHNTFASDMQSLDLAPDVFHRMKDVNYEDISIVSGDGDGFVAQWRGDIKGFAYTEVTIDERGNVEKSGEKEVVEGIDEQAFSKGTYSVRLTGEKMTGIDAWLVSESSREETIEQLYKGISEFYAMAPALIREELDMPHHGRLVAEAFEYERIDDNKLRLSFRLEDQMPEILNLIPPIREQMTESRDTAKRAECARRLRHLGLVLHMYANENEGRFPKGETGGEVFRTLKEEGFLEDKRILVCPENPDMEIDFDDPEGVGYYIDPAVPENADPNRPVMADRPPWQLNHGDGVNVLFADGSVHFIKPEDSGPSDKISNPFFEEDTDIYADTGDPEKHAWIRWEREPEVDKRETFGPRTFNSEMRFSVWAENIDWETMDRERNFLGRTPSEEPLAVPECTHWWVEPRADADELDWEALAGVVRRQGIPGLDLPHGTRDEHLEHLQGFEELRTLRLGGTQVTDQGLRHLEGLKKLRELWLLRTPVTGEGLRYLAGLENLRILWLSRTKVTDENLRHLEGLEDLWRLGLSNTEITDDGLRHLAGLDKLRILQLYDTEITDEGLRHLGELGELRYLGLSRTGITGEGFRYLEGLNKLRRLNLYRTEVTDEGLRYLKGLEGLWQLWLIDTKVTGEGLRHLGGLPKLQKLWLGGTQVTDEGLRHLEGPEELRVLGLSQTKITDEALRHLEGLNSLRRLLLYRTEVTDAGVEKLKEVNPELRVLH